MSMSSIGSAFQDWSGLEVNFLNVSKFFVLSELIIYISLDEIKALSSVLTQSLSMCVSLGHKFKFKMQS